LPERPFGCSAQKVPDPFFSPGEAATLNLAELEKRAVLRALAETGWNKAQAAARLGIFPSSLYKKMRRLGIPLKERP
jgi:transcriptional regulator of acetoin/glycerol metabolism